MTNQPFEDPATMTGIDYTALRGSLLLFEVLAVEEIKTVHSVPGERDPAVRVNATVLDGPQAGTVLSDALVFPKVLVGQLRPRVGKMVLGRLGQGQARPGLNPPWTLDAATDTDRAKASSFLAGSRIASASGPAGAPF